MWSFLTLIQKSIFMRDACQERFTDVTSTERSH